MVARPLVIGLVATSMIVVGGALAGAAAPGAGGRLWSVPTVPMRPSSDLLGGLVLFYAGLIVLVRAWFLLRRTARRVPVSIGAVVAVVVVWSVPLLAGPPLGSRDVYAYAAQARLAEEGFDVYEQGPRALGDDPVLDSVDPLYLDAPVVYGPVFVAISSAVSARTGGEVLHLVLAFRALAVLGLAITAVGVWDLARTHRRDPTDALILAVANPLVLLHLVSGAHNEALMLAFLVSGVALGTREQAHPVVGRLLGIGLCAFAGAIKMPGALGVAFLAWPWILETTGRRARVVRAVVAGGEAFAVIALAGRQTGWGWGWVDAITAAKPIDAYLSVTRVLGGAVQVATGLDAAIVLGVARLTGLLLAAAGATWLLVRGRQSAVTALAWSLLLFAVLHPTTQPWYLTWGLMLWAATSAGGTNRFYVALTAAAAFMVPPVGPQLGLVLLEHSGTLSLALAAFAVALFTFSPAPVEPARRRRGLEAGLVSVIVPTRHEADTLPVLVERLLGVAGRTGRRIEILVVDDSDDDTPAVVAALARVHPEVRLAHREADRRWGGLGGAVCHGFDLARGEVAVVMDADLQHPPEDLPRLVDAVADDPGLGADVAVASRRVTGGVDQGLRWGRRRLSGVTAALARLAFPRRVGRVADPMSGFFAVRLGRLDLDRLRPDGFKILVEILGTHPDLVVVERPFTFAGRTDGESKAGVAEAVRYIGHLLDLRLRTSRPWSGAVSRDRVFRSA